MPGEHAQLSPSAATRWLQCPASVRMAATVPRKPDSPYAAEGTHAHDLAEILASEEFGRLTSRQLYGRRRKWQSKCEDLSLSPEAVTDMASNARSYVKLLREIADRVGGQVFLEQRLDTGVPSCWGTSDAVIVSATHIEIVDLKYGAGVKVSAQANPQLRLYALGALDLYGDLLGDVETVGMTIYQPRAGDGLPDTEVISAEELREWRRQIQPVALEALGDDARFGPSESACRWCPAAGICRAQLEQATRADFGPADTLSMEELSAALDRLPEVRAWAQAVHDAAMRLAYDEGRDIPGYKIVAGTGRRVITDETGAVEALGSAGYPREEVCTTRVKGITDLTKILRARGDRLEDVLEGYVSKTEGKPALVPADDPRQPISPEAGARADFTDE